LRMLHEHANKLTSNQNIQVATDHETSHTDGGSCQWRMLRGHANEQT